MSEMLFPITLTIHVVVGLFLIGLILIQHGKGADAGATFGGGSANGFFGASGSANFLSRTTAALATVFFITSLALTYLAGYRPKAPESVMDGYAPAVPTETSPAEASPATEIPVPSAIKQQSESVSTVPVPTTAPDASKEKTAPVSSDGAKDASNAGVMPE